MGAGGTKKPRVHAEKLRMLEPGSEIYRRSDLENLQLVSILDGKFSSLQEVIIHSFSHFAQEPFLSSDYTTEKPYTFAQIWNWVQHFGASLGRICPEKYGELTCFGLFTDKGLDWVIAELACWLYGLTVVPMDLEMSVGEVGRIVEETKMQTILCSWQTFSMISTEIRKITEENKKSSTEPHTNKGAFQSLSYFLLSDSPMDQTDIPNSKIIQVSKLFPSTPAYRSPPKLTSDRERTHIASISYTRGTTGLRKGVYILQKQLLGAIISLQNAMPIDNTDKILSFQSLSCVFEQNLVLYAMKSGAQVYLHTQSCTFVGKIDYYETVLEAARTKLPSIFRLNGDLIGYLLACLPTFEDTDSLKGPISPTITPNIRMFIVDFDLPSDPNALKRLKTHLNRPILQGYGLTEAAGYVLISDAYTGTIGRVGAPAAYAEVKLVPTTESREKAGKKGFTACELWYRTVVPFAGYVSFPTVRPAKAQESSWVSTGDLFQIHKNTEFEYICRSEKPLPTTPPQYRSRIEQRLKVCFGVQDCWVRLVNPSPVRVVCFVQVHKQAVDKWLQQERSRSGGNEGFAEILISDSDLSMDDIVMCNDTFREEFVGSVRSEAINAYGLRSFEVPLEMYCLQHPPDANDERKADSWKRQRDRYLETLHLIGRIS